MVAKGRKMEGSLVISIESSRVKSSRPVETLLVATVTVMDGFSELVGKSGGSTDRAQA